MRPLSIAFTGLILLALPPCQTSNADEPVARMPWHLARVYWEMPEPLKVETIAVDFEITADIPASANLFVVPLSTVLNGRQFYTGLVTNIDDALDAKGRPHSRIGRGLILTRFGDREDSAVRPGLGGYYFASDHEGPHVSARTPYAWRKGRYTARLTRLEREDMRGQPHVWAAFFLHCHERGEHVFCGAVRFPGKELSLGSHVVAFVEIFDKDSARRPESVPAFSVALGGLSVNGRPVTPKAVHANYQRDVPNHAEVTPAAGSKDWPKGLAPGSGACLITVSATARAERDKLLVELPMK